MANKSNLSGCFNILNKNGLQWYVDKYAIPASLHPVLPEKNMPIYPFVPRKIGVYTRLFDYCNYRLPLTKFLIEVLLFHEVHISQMNPFGLAKVCHFELACRSLGSDPDLDVFRAFYKLNRSGSWYTFEVRKKNACWYTWITTSLKYWKDRFFLIDDRCVPTDMTWRLKKSRLPPPLPEDFAFNKNLYAALIKEVGRVQKYPEHILVMGRISTIWAEQEWYPTLRWNGEVTGLKEALRLKSFDSTELDVRATRTPKGDPPYLSVVQENLYPIRERTTPINQGGSAGQGGSGSVPSIRTVNVAPVQSVAVAGGDRGKEKVSHEVKGSDSKGCMLKRKKEEGDDDGAEAQAQVSLKRRRNTSKPDPNPKIMKRKKLDFHTITLDDDEVDQVTEFSTAGGLLENLDAHLHSSRTPRDRPVNLPTSPLSFGGPTTKVIEDIHMPEPLSFKKIEPSPSGKPTTGVASNVSKPSPQPINSGDSASSSPLWYETEVVFLFRELGSGDALDMDSACALEKYVPEWSLANKDRIVDALSAKMALFHLGTPAEHAHYRKMSGPELGNALMLNQAQSNSLVVETYKRWVESESNCRKFEREIANLKNEDNIRSKTKQELSSLRSQVDRLKEQVSDAKEVNKSSQASAAAAYEARDKALQDLETLKLKFGDLEKKLSDVGKRSEAELKEMQKSYDQLLADHHRLTNDKDELERARDRETESHRTTIDEAKGMLTRCDGEMVELYAQVSELMLTKQWFLMYGIAWVVKLVHQSPELEKVVADLVNCVNVVGVNEGIKQGFQAAKGSARSFEEVPGYDEGAKDALDAAIKAFDDFHISVLGKVADLVDKPLSVIKQRSELPIVKEGYEA
ncbi:hypothetical protein HanPSC8_Chr01g0011211 [Helianthus annuus]|nr:hypothetical protein HanHA89_Chr01g0010221 [Helianthus annuus]KAJ0782521.1 hypothetical protein HanLR1_Chr01g0009161 [Helianthus annuus]KAJ0956144.1 hypothetical protein HanPSC8_Chr01g0011211 [Helianthus annuus]